MSKTILIAGGAGFIGSNLSAELLTLGHNVHCIDSLISGREENILELKKNPAFTFQKADVTKLPEFKIQFDWIFHLASPASVPDYQAHPFETALSNSFGTQALLELARQTNARFLFTSTSEIYGDPKEHPQKETYWGNVNPVGPRACYDEAKRFGEMMTILFHTQHKVDTRIVRIFNTYGPKMRKTDGRVVSNFINQALAGEPMTIYGTGAQTRSFCYVDDLVDGLIAMMQTDGLAGEIVNLGNPSEFTMNDFAQKVKVMTISNSDIVHKPLPVDDPKERRPDITKAKKLLGWEPMVSVDEGLARTIEYYRKEA